MELEEIIKAIQGKCISDESAKEAADEILKLLTTPTKGSLEKKLLDAFGYTEDGKGADAKNQLKIYEILDWFNSQPLTEGEQILKSCDYETAMTRWEESFLCGECGSDEYSEFRYDRSVSNGEVWICNNCANETMVSEKPNEDNF